MGPTTCSGLSRFLAWPTSKHFLPIAVAVVGVFGSACKPQATDPEPPARSIPPGPPPAQIWKEFSGEKAFAHAKAQCDIGPRPSGSPELEKARKLITAELERNGWKVERQTFTDTTPRGPVQFVNLIGRYDGSDKTQHFLVASHYDTKIFDTIRFIGASDGASSTGALMELSRVLARDPALARRVELVFFDGEEAVVQYRQTNGVLSDGLYGSRHYAKELAAQKRNQQFRAGVLWDMIGNSKLNITLDPDSPPQLLQEIFAAADALNARSSFSLSDRTILDDHSPLNEAQVPTIDLIGFDYPYWHTADDTLDKLSPQSLQTVGAVTLRWLKTAAGQNARSSATPKQYVGQ
ncbi:MAG: M28 family peptidase [Verrucomicrobia bacterium]|nr:M28 family peptidase [Verrucomicrobiota bacterium]